MTAAAAPGSANSALLLYDYLLVRGGAEYVTLLLAREMTDLDVCVASYDPAMFAPAELGAIRCLQTAATPRQAVWRGLRTRAAFAKLGRSPRLNAYRQVIYTGLYAPLAARKRPGGCNILYCHMPPPPFAYDWRDDYLARQPAWRRPLFRRMAAGFRRCYAAAVAAMDHVVANAHWVGERYRDCFGVDYSVVYPPCDCAAFRWSSQGDYYLSAARLEPHKRVDVAVEAFLSLPERRLVIASQGSELQRLRRLSQGAPNIDFIPVTARKELSALLANCIATLCLGKDEPFGIAAVESMAAGKPVIAAAEGGWRESILPEQTGLLVDPAPQTVAAAVCALPPERAATMRAACERRARLFDETVFLHRMRSLLAQAQ